jgi:hypothetical protein
VTALVLVHQRQRFDSFKALMPLVRQVAGSTTDPIVKLYLCVNENFDFETAHNHLAGIKEVCCVRERDRPTFFLLFKSWSCEC